jgi:hypothetical protein
MPPQPFDYEHMDLSLTLEPGQNLVRGVVSYEVSPKQNGLSTLHMDIAESAIDGVTINGEPVEYSVSENKVEIALPDTTSRGEGFEVAVTWQSNSSFGLYKDHLDNFWSSKNPLAHRHWLPGFDHPRNELSFEAEFIVPLETEVMFNGTLDDSQIYSENRKKVWFSSDVDVPFTGLGFVHGKFLISEVTSGLTKVRLFSSESTYSEEERAEIVKEASALKKEIENELSREYPWEGVNIVILPDNFWEERTHGAGIIYLYENLGSLSAQLKRGLYAQWFGEFHRQEQFFDLAGYMDYTRTALHYRLSEDEALIENPDSLISIYEWNVWQKGFRDQEAIVKTTVMESLSELIRQPSGVFSFSMYPEQWYEETGIPFNNLTYPQFGEENVSGAITTDEPASEYALDTFYDEMSSELLLIFNLRGGEGEELYTLEMTSHEFGDSATTEISFTGLLDTISVDLTPAVEYVTFKGVNITMDQITIDEFPLFFLTNQLRSSDPVQRKLAAELLVNYTDNPDIQLALNDVLNTEQNPEVRAALLSTMAAFTHGASGTEQQFLDDLNSEDPELQITALKALVNYPDNEMVKNGVRSMVIRTDSEDVFKAAVESYSQLATDEEVVSLTQRLTRSDDSGKWALTMIGLTSDADSAGMYPQLAEDYLMEGNPYQVRKKAFEVLKELQYEEDIWVSRIAQMREDRDPRIRFISLEAISKLGPVKALQVLTSAEQGEYDARILFKIDELKDTLSE